MVLMVLSGRAAGAVASSSYARTRVQHLLGSKRGGSIRFHLSTSKPSISSGAFRYATRRPQLHHVRFFSADTAAVKPRKSKFTVVARSAFGVGLGVGAGLLYCSKKNADVEAKNDSIRANTIEERLPSREEIISRLRSGEEFDLLVVGGGATGAGVALDAATRGLKVACVEQEDFASGTSSKSTKLLWAGSRYLVLAMTKLFHPYAVTDPLKAERSYMLQMNPHLTYWVPVAVPIKHWIIWPPPFGYAPAALGPCTGLYAFFFKFYDSLGLFASPNSYTMWPETIKFTFPQLHAEALKYCSVFYEGGHNDARTNLAIAFTGMLKGAAIANYVKVDEILFDHKGHATGAICSDVAEGGAPMKIQAKKIVYCGGPFTDGLRRLSEVETFLVHRSMVNGAGGTHIVIPAHYCPRDIGMCDMQTKRGSYLFFLPWQGHTLVGTTDQGGSSTKKPAEKFSLEADIEYLVSECSKYLRPELQVRRSDISVSLSVFLCVLLFLIFAWYGVRPLAVDPNAADSTSASRDHVVSYNPENAVTFVSGGKWTTWREMAEDAVDKVLQKDEKLKEKAGPSQTLQTPLIGAGRNGDFAPTGYTRSLPSKISREYGLDPEVAHHLVNTYGTRASDVLACAPADSKKFSRLSPVEGAPMLECEVVYAAQHEHVCSPIDILARRTRLAFVDSEAAHNAAPRVIELLGDIRNWSPARRARELQACRETL
ncbi:unnamed protein product, partial [Amoebophrya sp. A25]|eukprot:GSA25T00016500001.1